MGGLDKNDAIPYADAFDAEERKLIYELIGKEMLPLRWENCKNIYRNAGVKSTVKTYESIGHEQAEFVKNEIVGFFIKTVKQQ